MPSCEDPVISLIDHSYRGKRKLLCGFRGWRCLARILHHGSFDSGVFYPSNGRAVTGQAIHSVSFGYLFLLFPLSYIAFEEAQRTNGESGEALSHASLLTGAGGKVCFVSRQIAESCMSVFEFVLGTLWLAAGLLLLFAPHRRK